MTKMIAVANQKGGVGKSTTAHTLGYLLNQKGKRVLMVDFDPQASLTAWFQEKDPLDLKDTIAERMDRHIRFVNGDHQDRLLEKDGLFLYPANKNLAAIRFSLVSAMRKEYALKDILEPLQARFDYILIDTAPALDVLTMNVFAAADEVLVTCTAQPMAWAGFGDLKDTIDRIKMGKVNENLTIAGILITMLNPQVNISKAVLCTIAESFGENMMYKAKIPKSVKVDEAAAAHQTIVEYSPRNPVAEAYVNFADEFLNGRE